LFKVGLKGFEVIRNEGEYVLDVIAEASGAHIIGGGNQRSCKDFPLLDYWLLVSTNECGQTHRISLRLPERVIGNEQDPRCVPNLEKQGGMTVTISTKGNDAVRKRNSTSRHT
jgi:hypothetical protein